MLKIFILTLLVTTVEFSSLANVLNPRCRSVSDKKVESIWIHNIVTGRKDTHYERLLNPQHTESVFIVRQPPKFDTGEIINQNKSVLSLGEGKSEFIEKLNIEMYENNQAPTHHAVDVYYRAKNINGRFVGEREWLSSHFHNQLFHKLDLRDAVGNRLKFDEIISANSLYFVLRQLVRSGKFAEADQLMRQVLSHLKTGGHLRFWGAKPISNRVLNKYWKGLGERIQIETMSKEILVDDAFDIYSLYWLRK